MQFPNTPRATPPLEQKQKGLGSETLRQLHALIANPANYIDEGGAGVVYRMPQGLCIKVMQEVRHDKPDADKYDLGNTTDQEALFLKELSKMQVKGVRSPRYIGHSRKKSNGIEGIVMEELNAVNLEHSLSKQEPLPEQFQWHSFMDALEAYISELHEKGIAHGDMAPRNVMIDKETGLPRVIDFGRSMRKDSLSPTIWEQKVAKEWEQIEAISEKIKWFLESQKA